MPLIRSESQGGGDVLAHYVDSEKYADRIRKMNKAMREMLPMLNARLPNTVAWGLTSHNSLSLMSVSEYDAGDMHVTIESYHDGYFRMGYHPPSGYLPIPDSYVLFGAVGATEAVDRILIAMAASGGWPDSDDLAEIA